MRDALSRLFRGLDTLTSRAFMAAMVLVAVLGFLGIGLFVGMPDGWHNWFATIASAITLVMVFSIQHTQKREQAVTQLKLDELLKAEPDADDRVVKVEASSDDELHDLRQRHVDHHTAVREGR